METTITPQQLVDLYPQLDTLMAETLLKASQNGTLQKYVDDWPEPNKETKSNEVIVGAIEVLPPKEISPTETIA